MRQVGRGTIVSAAVVLVLLVTMGVLGNRIFERGPAIPATVGVPVDESGGVKLRTLTLFFGDPDSTGLSAERRDVLGGAERSRLVAAALEDLAQGPIGDLVATLPPGTRVRHVFIDDDGTVFIDFNSAIREGLEGGLSRELLAVRSMARTLSANFDGLSRFQILVDGKAVESPRGHLDLAGPLEIGEWN